MDNIKFAVSSYSFSKLIKKGVMTQFDTIKKAQEMGFDGIEIVEFDAPNGEDILSYAKRLKDECERVGIEPCNLCIGADFINGKGVSKEEEIGRIKKIIDGAHILGVKSMRHDCLYKLGEYKTFYGAIPEIAKGIREVADYAKEKGIRTMVENHGFICQDALRVEKLYNEVNHDNFSLLLDMGNFLCVDEDPVKSASIIAPYATFVHAKDFYVKSGCESDPGEQFFSTRGGNYLKGAILGHGNVPVKQILRILKKAEYQGYISLEYEGWEDVIEGIRIGFDNLKKYVGDC